MVSPSRTETTGPVISEAETKGRQECYEQGRK